jgi:hypothetical protein
LASFICNKQISPLNNKWRGRCPIRIQKVLIVLHVDGIRPPTCRHESMLRCTLFCSCSNVSNLKDESSIKSTAEKKFQNGEGGKRSTRSQQIFPFFQFLIGLKKVLKNNCGTTKYTNTPWTLHEHTVDTPRFVLFFVLRNSH